MGARDRERQLLEELAKTENETTRRAKEVLQLRLQRYQDRLVDSGCDLTRGRAQECRDLLKVLFQ
jgi:hypothetical protein